MLCRRSNYTAGLYKTKIKIVAQAIANFTPAKNAFSSASVKLGKGEGGGGQGEGNRE